MLRHRYFAPGLCLILVLICPLIPKKTLADDSSQGKPVRLYANGGLGPIGMIYSLSPFAIDGRLTYGEQTIWGGELIQAPPDSSVRVNLDSIGRVTLKSAAIARLTTTFTTLDGERHPLLVASLISGDMIVDLRQDAGAYVESSGSSFTASGGANFRVAIREGRALVDMASGEMQVGPQATQRGLKIRLVESNPDPLLPPVDLGLRFDVERRTTRQTQWQVTDENDKPVPDVPLILTVIGNVGQFGNAATFSGITNAQGIVSAPFTAGPSPAQGSITANIPGTNVSANAQVTVKSQPTGLRNKILIGSAAVATTVIVFKTRGKGPIKQSPPPTIIP